MFSEKNLSSLAIGIFCLLAGAVISVYMGYFIKDYNDAIAPYETTTAKVIDLFEKTEKVAKNDYKDLAYCTYAYKINGMEYTSVSIVNNINKYYINEEIKIYYQGEVPQNSYIFENTNNVNMICFIGGICLLFTGIIVISHSITAISPSKRKINSQQTIKYENVMRSAEWQAKLAETREKELQRSAMWEKSLQQQKFDTSISNKPTPTTNTN